ncbi:MAG TPA: DUF2852 domain-containing protein [Microvirga sp.]|jgi:hypothetical protein|nr:DUF2852 domain-containing protein [Microvirga sp.]
MHSFAGTAPWNTNLRHRRSGPPFRRSWEITGIIVGFIFAWPLALAYLAWKFTGYPMPEAAKAYTERTFGWRFVPAARTSHAPFTGNSAFEEYRQRELQRLEEERRKLDEESRAFAEFVEELKRAKDREEFDAFMQKRRGQAA